MKIFAALMLLVMPIAFAQLPERRPALEGAHGLKEIEIDVSVSHGNEAETAAAVNHANPLQITTVSTSKRTRSFIAGARTAAAPGSIT